MLMANWCRWLLYSMTRRWWCWHCLLWGKTNYEQLVYTCTHTVCMYTWTVFGLMSVFGLASVSFSGNMYSGIIVFVVDLTVPPKSCLPVIFILTDLLCKAVNHPPTFSIPKMFQAAVCQSFLPPEFCPMQYAFARTHVKSNWKLYRSTPRVLRKS